MYALDSVLIRACLKGDRVSWDKLVERYGSLIYTIATSRGLKDDDVRLAVEKVFLDCFKNLNNLQKQKSIVRWMIATAWRESTKLSQKINAPFAQDRDDPESPPSELAQRWEQQHTGQQALQTLGSPCRDLLTMLFSEDPPPNAQAVSRRLGIPAEKISQLRADCFQELEKNLHDIETQNV